MSVRWCQLRKLPIEQDLVSELWCHHWTARLPRLPAMAAAPTFDNPLVGDRQLDLGEVLKS